MIPLLVRLANVDDVRRYIPHIVKNQKIQYYKAFKNIKQQKEMTPVDYFINSLKNLRNGALTLWKSRTPKTTNIEWSKLKITKESLQNKSCNSELVKHSMTDYSVSDELDIEIDFKKPLKYKQRYAFYRSKLMWFKYLETQLLPRLI